MKPINHNPRANPWLKTWATPLALGALAVTGTKYMIEPRANGVALIADHDCMEGCNKTTQRAFAQDWQSAIKLNKDPIQGPKWREFLQRIQVANPATETQVDFVNNENTINQRGPKFWVNDDLTGTCLTRVISFKNLFDWYQREEKILANPQAYKLYLQTDPNRFARRVAKQLNEQVPPSMEEILKGIDLSKPILGALYKKGGWKLCSEIMLWSESF